MAHENKSSHRRNMSTPRFISCEFPVFRLINPDGVLGYEIVAANDNRAYCLLVSSSHVVLQEGSWESSIALNIDYEKTGQKLHFPMDEVYEIVSTRYFWDRFSLTYRRDTGKSDSLTVVLGESDTHHEIDYFFLGRTQAKGNRDVLLTRDSAEANDVLQLRNILSSFLESVIPA